MAWSAATATSGILFVVARVVAGLRAAPIPGGVKLHVALAAANLSAAASAGILLGLDKVYHFLPGFVLANVFAHAHLAAVGWAAMMVVGVGYRLLPMVIPAKAPSGITVYASAILIELGVLVLFAALIAQSAWARAGGGLRRAACGGSGHLARRRVFDRSVSPLRAAVRHGPPSGDRVRRLRAPWFPRSDGRRHAGEARADARLVSGAGGFRIQGADRLPVCDVDPVRPGRHLHRLDIRDPRRRGGLCAERDSSSIRRRLDPAGCGRPVGRRQLGCRRPGTAGFPAVVTTRPGAERAGLQPIGLSREPHSASGTWHRFDPLMACVMLDLLPEVHHD